MVTGLVGEILEDREMQQFGVEMEDVEPVRHATDAIEHQDGVGDALGQPFVGQQGTVPTDDEICVHPAFAIGEDRDLVALGAERVGKA